MVGDLARRWARGVGTAGNGRLPVAMTCLLTRRSSRRARAGQLVAAARQRTRSPAAERQSVRRSRRKSTARIMVVLRLRLVAVAEALRLSGSPQGGRHLRACCLVLQGGSLRSRVMGARSLVLARPSRVRWFVAGASRAPMGTACWRPGERRLPVAMTCLLTRRSSRRAAARRRGK